MASRRGCVSVQRKPLPRKSQHACRSSLARKTALTLLLVVATLLFAAIADILPPAVVAQAGAMQQPAALAPAVLLQDTPDSSVDTPEPPLTQTPPPPAETGEPSPTETPQPPADTAEPTPEATAEETPEGGETAAPGTGEPAEATVSVTTTATATPRPPIWPTDWPLGTIRVGEESAPPAQPVRVTLAEWIRLALALAIVVAVALLGAPLLHRLLDSIVASRGWDLDEILLAQIRPLLSWWLAAIGFHVAVWWVGFQNGPARALFADLAFLAYVGVATLTLWRLVDPGIDLYALRISDEEQAATVERLRPLMRRWARVLIAILAVLVGLGRFQGGFSAPTILVVLIGLAVSLAARNTLTDAIAGLFILVDQPFRIGHRVEVQGVDTWATVVNIGLRTSVLLTKQNVEIIVPNSTIGKNQVINYNYPDPRYRMQTHVGIAFGADVEHARRVMADAVRQADGVLPDEPVDALYVEIADSAMIFRIRWWIDFRDDWETSYDRVHTALDLALARAGIDSPYPGQSVVLEVEDETLAGAWQAWQTAREAGSNGLGDNERTVE
ncbi:MAG: mechanosensitive ion channel [Anaerolineae bacterium]